MTSRCVDEESLVRLMDGELTENEAKAVRQHVRACDVCAARAGELERLVKRLRGPLPGAEPAALVDEVMQRLASAVVDPAALPAKPRAIRWPLFVAGGLAVAAAALIVAPRLLRTAPQDGDTFQARGGPAAGSPIARAVGVTVRGARGLLVPGARVRSDEAYGVRTRNLLGDAVYLLAFAVDAKGAVHWICPAYVDPASDPLALRIDPSPDDAPAGSAMELDAPAPGPMRLVAIVSPSPLRVRDVDTLPAQDLSADALKARWPAADVRDLLTVNVEPAP